jgi:linearmycin/streptolysin S transport system permease protein
MRTVIAIARHDLRVVMSDKGAVLWLFLLPIIFATFFGLVMGGGSSPTDAKVRLTVVDADEGLIARLLIDELESERLVLTFVAPADKEATIDKVRTLVLPSGLTEAVLAGEPTALRLEKDPDTSTEAALVVQARIISAIAGVLGRLVEAKEGLEPGSPLTTEVLTGLDPGPDLVVIESRFAGEAKITPGGFAQSIPGNTVMFVMLIALTFGAATISGERSGGQLRRLVTTPASKAEIAAGKIAGRLVIAFLQVSVLMAVGVAANRAFGITIGDQPFATWIVLLIYALAVAPLGVAFGSWFTDPDRAASIGVITTMVMAGFGGCMWPLEVVSEPLQRMALVFPTGWAMRALHGTISFGMGLQGVLVPIAVLLGYALVFSVIAAKSLRID